MWAHGDHDRASRRPRPARLPRDRCPPRRRGDARSATRSASSCGTTSSTRSATGSRRASSRARSSASSRKLGLLGMHLDGYGLPGASSVAYGLTCMELEAGDAGVRSAVSVQGSLAMFPIWKFGSEEQKERWLPPMHTGDVIGCFGLTEPDAGSDPGSMRTHARRDGSDWILNGAKMWITNGTIADIAIVWARTDDDAIHGFIVERDMPGFSAPEIHKKLSLRASVTSELVLQDVRVPGGKPPPRRHDAARPAVVPQRGAFRDRLRRRRLGTRVLRVRRSSTRRSESSSASRSRATSSPSRSSPRWRSSSTAASSSHCTWAA